ncbi:M28 family metallopeptidase [Actinoplanes xinjiangensis]|uniref:Zn-dependent M28 family amino/carboxypeptidase n=1 Tax=Actinoplanes xinjiangensis TaxID=512350 RepID=A0A316EH01_9ACTN|nr:M28 family metallopeptidase [Actinoplanes xinjiangensis]PWK31202.1 Zn-dependent M28 family amino/carboxypeptidase [Actinoplanes xinjiangensis]GIF44119.1 aminopeptidase [Actinoplanes xinjiangensis]
MSHDDVAPTRRRSVRVLSAAAIATVLTVAPATAAAAGGHGHGHGHGHDQCARQVNDTYAEVLKCVSVDGVLKHLKQFQRIADRSTDPHYPGSRAAGTKGYADSVKYVSGLLRKAGYRVTLDPFEFQFAFPAVLDQITPTAASYETGAFTNSPSGDVTGGVVPVDINLTGTRASTSACEEADFTGLDFSGTADIALVQRGGCDFVIKARNADAAGAEAVILFNQGNDPTREALIVGTLGEAPDVTIPVVGASFADGSALAAAGSTAHVRVLPTQTRTDVNVIAELPGRNRDNVVMAGSHLDSVTAGPGINDNGSGSAAILETALTLAKTKPQNTVRFAWWGAEEDGLLGSAAYVAELSQAEKDKIALYLNYDMVGSPNYIFQVYDADQSSFPAPVVVPEGSTALEELFESYYTWKKLPYDDAEFSGRSDYQAFIEAGIPSGGLFTGAEVVKSEQQAAIWGGTAGASFDPNYHEAGDDITNLDLKALEVNSDLIAFAQLTFAYSTESVNGVRGRPVPGKPIRLPAPAGPQGTFNTGDGGHKPHHPES